MLDSLGDHCVRTGNYCPPRCYFPTSHLRRSSLLAKRRTSYLIRVLEVPALHPHTSDFHYQLILPHSSQISDGLAARVSGWGAHAKPPLLAAAATCSEWLHSANCCIWLHFTFWWACPNSNLLRSLLTALAELDELGGALIIKMAFLRLHSCRNRGSCSASRALRGALASCTAGPAVAREERRRRSLFYLTDLN